MNKSDIIISGHKFPGCQKYWLIKRKDYYGADPDAYFFDVSMGYSTFYCKRKTLQEAEDYLLDFIKRSIQKKLKTAERLVIQLTEFLEDERLLTTEDLLEKYRAKE